MLIPVVITFGIHYRVGVHESVADFVH